MRSALVKMTQITDLVVDYDTRKVLIERQSGDSHSDETLTWLDG